MNGALTLEAAARREETAQLGLWMFLATVAMLFAAFTSAYLVRQSGSDWAAIVLPPMLWLSTAVLALSSLALELGRRSGLAGRWRLASAWMGVALGLGIGFLAAQFSAWRSLITAGVYLPATPHSSFFFMMSGAHGLHVVAALVVLAWAAFRTWDGTGQRTGRRWRAIIRRSRTFWHFLLAMWLYVFALLSVV
jgi:cytochrome c oxidase subunit 3